jgi:hypothetical protein
MKFFLVIVAIAAPMTSCNNSVSSSSETIANADFSVMSTGYERQHQCIQHDGQFKIYGE